MHGSEVTTSVRGWLFTAARTTIAQWKRARKNFPEPIPAHQTETNSAFEIIDRCDDIDHLLDRLTPARSAALRAIYLDGLTYEEAAIKLESRRRRLMIDFYGQSDSCDNYGRKWHEPIPESIHCQESVLMVSLETAVRLPGGLVPDPP